MTDSHRRFLFDDTAVRGGWVRLDDTYREVLARHDYPPALRRMLGELLAATALLASNVKFGGSLIIQVQSAGPLRLLVVECDEQGGLRAIAKWEGTIADYADLHALAPGGRCVMTLDPRDGAQMYQGIVAIERGSIAALLEHHMANSEQLATRIWLAANGERASGMMLQRLPASGGSPDPNDEAWERVTMMAATVRSYELITLDAESLLGRVFSEDAVRLFPARPVAFSCGCSEARVANALLLLGRGEVEQVLDEQGRIEVACEFCNRKYVFDRSRALALFAQRDAASTSVH